MGVFIWTEAGNNMPLGLVRESSRGGMRRLVHCAGPDQQPTNYCEQAEALSEIRFISAKMAFP
jgi:hypothetical protein